MLELDVKGIKEAIAKLDVLRRAYPAAAHAACFTAATEIMQRAVPLVPVLTGETRDSAFVMRTKPVRFGFAHWIAALVHELPYKHPHGGQWKFLATPFNEMTPGLPARMATLIEQYALEGVTIDNVPAIFSTTPRYDTRPGASVRLKLGRKGRFVVKGRRNKKGRAPKAGRA